MPPHVSNFLSKYLRGYHGFRNYLSLLRWLPLSFLFIAFYTSLAGSTEIDIQAKTLEYDEENKFMVAAGSVTVTWQRKTLTCQEVRFWMAQNYMLAKGSVTLTEDLNKLSGDCLSYDLKTSTGEIVNAEGLFDIWYFRARDAVKKNETQYQIKGAKFTTCNLSKPHYFIRASSAKVTLNRRVTIFNPILYVDGIPVFYFPIFSQGLGPHKDDLRIEPGYDATDGFIVRASYGYPLSAYSYGRLYLDYFGRRGWGEGIQYTYSIPNARLDVYGYHVLDNIVQHERWTARSSSWQRFDPLWTGQAEFNYVSDSSFNNTFFQNNWQQTSQEMRSNFAATRQSGRSNLRFTTERVDVYNPITNAFDMQSLTIPRVDYTLFPRKGNLPFYTNLSASFQNQYSHANDYFTLSSVVDANAYKDYRYGRNMTFTPRVGITESWQNRTSSTSYNSSFLTSYYSTLNLRYRPAYWADWDFTYSIRLRSKVNSPLADTNANDYGIETNLFSFQNSMYIDRLTLRNSFTYDLHNYRTSPFNDWWQRFSPLTNELIWFPSYFISLYTREVNSIYPFKMDSLQSELRWEELDVRYFGLGVFYQSTPAPPNRLDFSGTFGLWLSPKWRIDYAVRTNTTPELTGFTINSQEVKLYRDLHCWEATLTYRRRVTEEEIYFLITTKSSVPGKGKAPATAVREAQQGFNPLR